MQAANLQVRRQPHLLGHPRRRRRGHDTGKGESRPCCCCAGHSQARTSAGWRARYSEDTATRAEGGDLGWFGKDILPKPIEEFGFSP